MHFVKLLLTASFAVAAALRGSVTLLADVPVRLPTVLSGSSGIAVETVVSLIAGTALALQLARPRGRKAVRP